MKLHGLKNIAEEFLKKLNNIDEAIVSVHFTNGKTEYRENFSCINREMKQVDGNPCFRLASLSKNYTASAINGLIQSSGLKCDTRAKEILHELSQNFDEVSLFHLLNHCSGIPDYETVLHKDLAVQITDEDVLQLIKSSDDHFFKPGQRYRYSNTAYCLLSLIVERLSGKKFEDFMQENFFQPMSLQHSTYIPGDLRERVYGYRLFNGVAHIDDQSCTSCTLGDGGLYTSSIDLTKWIQHQWQQPKCDGFKLGTEVPGEYANGWFIQRISGKEIYTHTGSTCGFSNLVIQIPADKIVMIIFCNVTNIHHHFIPFEKYLKNEKILPNSFSFINTHLLTN